MKAAKRFLTSAMIAAILVSLGGGIALALFPAAPTGAPTDPSKEDRKARSFFAPDLSIFWNAEEERFVLFPGDEFQVTAKIDGSSYGRNGFGFFLLASGVEILDWQPVGSGSSVKNDGLWGLSVPASGYATPAVKCGCSEMTLLVRVTGDSFGELQVNTAHTSWFNLNGSLVESWIEFRPAGMSGFETLQFLIEKKIGLDDAINALKITASGGIIQDPADLK
jgi:hypothetical protein